MTPEDRVRAAFAELAEAVIGLVAEGDVPRGTTTDDRVELLTVEEFGRRCGLGRSSAWNAVSSGRVRSIRIGGARRVPATELARLAAGDVEVPASPRRSRQARHARDEHDLVAAPATRR